MSVLTVTDLRRHFGPLELLTGAALRIERGEKVGLVGRNGAGKTTLLRLIEGLDTPDGGAIELARGARLGHMPQRADFAPELTSRAYVASGLDEARATEAELHRVAERMAQCEGAEQARLLAQHGELAAHLELLGGWDLERRVEMVMAGLGLATELWDREARTLSGGEKSRVLLARELAAAPELLLLDEPTNHLDLAGIEWLEEFLREYKGAALLVSHDRRLLDRAVDAIVELERGGLKRYPGSYSRYVDIKQERFQSDLRAWEIQQDEIRKEEEFIRRHMGSQRTAEAKGRQKRLERLVRLVRPHDDVRRPVIAVRGAARGGDMVLEAAELACGHTEAPVVRGASFRVARGDRLGIVGPNGSGKSALLKTLAGRLPPRGGELRFEHGAACGYFDQESAELNRIAARGANTPFECVRRAYPQMDDLAVRSHLARFLFRGEQVDAALASLSGGERARLALALLALEHPTWLALDEPTNHLDLAARTALEEFLGEFEGALVVVSHDRAFLDALCTQILSVEGGRARLHRGNYSSWHDARPRGGAAAAGPSAESRRPPRAPMAARAPVAPARRAQPTRRAEAPAADGAGARADKGGKIRNPWLFKKIEEAIIALEAERETLNARLTSPEIYADASGLREIQTRLAEIESDLADKNAQWERWA